MHSSIDTFGFVGDYAKQRYRTVSISTRRNAEAVPSARIGWERIEVILYICNLCICKSLSDQQPLPTSLVSVCWRIFQSCWYYCWQNCESVRYVLYHTCTIFGFLDLSVSPRARWRKDEFGNAKVDDTCTLQGPTNFSMNWGSYLPTY
jgi:hypothetical protein